jgi:hypothetical protein
VSDLDLVDHYDMMNKVVERMLKGETPRSISKELGLKQVEVNRYIAEWQDFARNSEHIADRARDALVATDQHYNMIINRLWETVEEANANSDLKVKASTLKMISDIEKNRIEMLQKSGLLDNQELAQQVVETERKQEILVNILRTVANEYPDAAAFIRKELGRVTNTAEGTVIRVESD